MNQARKHYTALERPILSKTFQLEEDLWVGVQIFIPFMASPS